MHASEDKVHSEICDKDADECEYSVSVEEDGIAVNEAEKFLGSAVLFNDGGSHHQ